jgi:uncharacterized membrane protein
MSFTQGTDNQELSARVDELETRLEFLEAVILDEAAERELPGVEQIRSTTSVATEQASPIVAEAPTAPSPAEPAPEPEPEPVRKDLRKLQAAATADIAFEPPAAPQRSEPQFDLRDIEERLAGRALALVGGAALLLGAVFFLSLAFSRGWITPEMQVMLGLFGGSLGLMIGAVLLMRDEQIVGHVLTAVGLAVISLSLFAATSLYELIEPMLALAGVFVASVATTVIAIRAASQVVAGFGLAAALAAPPIMGAEPDLITLAYVAVVLVGVAAVSLWRTWPWLPPIAFVLSVLQLYQWIAAEPDPAIGVAALLGYWAVMTVAAGGESFRLGRRELSITSAPLFMAVGASVVGLAFILLEADTQRAAFLLALAALHAVVTAFFARRRGLLDPFGLLAGAYGTAMATAAVPLLLDASATSVVWTAEAAALAFFAGRRAHGPALMAAFVVYVVAAASTAYEAVLVGPLGESFELATTSSPESVAASFAFFAAAGTAMLFLVPVRACQLGVAGLVGLVALPMTALAFDGAAAVTVWMLVAVATIGVGRWLAYLPERSIRWRLGPALRWIRPKTDMEPTVALLPFLAGGFAIGLAVLRTVADVVAQDGLPDVPFSDSAGLSGLALTAGFIAVGLVAGGMASLRRSLFAAGSTIGLVCLVELPAPWWVVVWAALAIGAAWMARVDQGGFLSYRAMSLSALLVLAVLGVIEAPPTRLVVEAGGVPPHPLLVSEATLAIGSLIVGLAVVAAIARRRWTAALVTGLAALAGAATLYLLSVGVVDVFAGEAYRLGYGRFGRLDELTKEAQVALSVLWATIGVVVLGLGLLLRVGALRVAGLVVLGLATVKVFLVDLSSLDVAYRVITLVVLGLLLVASAYAWSRMKPGGTGGSPGHRLGAADAPRH